MKLSTSAAILTIALSTPSSVDAFLVRITGPPQLASHPTPPFSSAMIQTMRASVQMSMATKISAKADSSYTSTVVSSNSDTNESCCSQDQEADTSNKIQNTTDAELIAEANLIFDTIDTNQDGGISNEELRTYLEGIGYSTECIRSLFTALDKNVDGVISREEMQFAFGNYELNALYKAFGFLDDKMEVRDETYREAIESIRSTAQMDNVTSPERLTLLADFLFEIIDIDGSGEIDAEELRSHFRKDGSFTSFREVGHATNISVESILKALDLNEDGVISRDEMREGFRQYDPRTLSKALGLRVAPPASDSSS
eukprot:CAMPEP_0194112548 /NCGR_PEP_ID=MMETSP0150-20130528/12382_1 /TAXON_ID=122233 /ORGANISM="Chaetoceros debilis, Strain MM31A-1" /LENGTH=312 /DNA_ID=CAMNT_0038802221 /DNA_START=57 /DNA_END=995 /DNA_ORIENTATION=+